MRKSSPAWTIHGKKNQKKLITIIPGPGAYNPTSIHLDTSPHYTAQSSSRVRTVISPTPGPGTYDTRYIGDSSPRPM